MDKYKAIADIIDTRLKWLGMSKKEFAERMGAPPSSVTKWLSGEHNFTIDTLFKIESVLRIKIFNKEIVSFHHQDSHQVHSI